MWVVGLGLLAVLWEVPAPASAPIRLPWFVFAVAAFLVERYAVHLHFRGDNHTLTLGEIPLIMGLFFAAPVEFAVGRVVGGLVLFILVERQPSIKVAFNGAVSLVEAVLAGILWYALGGAQGQLATWGVLVAVAAMLVSQTVGSTLVWTVIGVVQGRFDARDLRESLTVAIPLSAANTAAALSVVALLLTVPQLAWMPIVPFVVMLIAYRAYGSERRHRDTLAFLYDVSRGVQRDLDPAAALTPMLESLRLHLSASVVELSVGGSGSGKLTTFRVRNDQPPQIETTDEVGGEHGVEEGSSHVPGHLIVAAAGPSGNHRLVLRAESGGIAADGFDEVGASLVESVVNLAATVVERAELNEMKTAFLSAVSHELRTPLAVVLGTATTLRHRGTQLRPEQTQLLTERLEAHAHRLDKLLTDLLDIDRLARGVIEPRRREVDVSLMASRLIDGLEVTTHPIKLYGTGVRGFVDGPQVERIVENLVRNAVKYTPDETPIEVSLQRLPEGVRILVEDRGPGVPDAAKSSILEPFVRLDSDHPSPGTGIGLSLVRRFAQLHGGDIEVRDRPGGGATFSVLLADDRPDLAEPVPGGSTPAGPATGADVVTLRTIA